MKEEENDEEGMNEQIAWLAGSIRSSSGGKARRRRRNNTALSSAPCRH
jgi:hypothetical protein